MAKMALQKAMMLFGKDRKSGGSLSSLPNLPEDGTTAATDQQAGTDETTKTIASLEEELKWAVKAAGKPAAELLEEKREFLKEKKALEEGYAAWEEDKAQYRQLITAQSKKLAGLEKKLANANRESSELSSQVSKVTDARGEAVLELASANMRSLELTSQVDKVTDARDEAVLELKKTKDELAASRRAVSAARKQTAQLEAETSRQIDYTKSWLASVRGLMGSEFTPRVLLVLKLTANTPTAPAPDFPVESITSLLDSDSTTELSREMLNMQLDGTAISAFANQLVDGRLGQQLCKSVTIQACGICSGLKFMPLAGTTGRCSIGEFPPNNTRTSCCSTPICSDCCLAAVIRSLETDWWRDLGDDVWLRCPMESCATLLRLPNSSSLELLLQSLSDKDVATHVTMYERVRILRSGLAKLNPSPAALKKAGEVHNQLIAGGKMCSFFDASLASATPDETGRLPPFVPGAIWTFKVDHEGGSLEIPFFMRLFKRAPAVRQCVVCAEALYDIDYSSAAEWIKTCDGIEGEWMWKVLLFPAKLGLGCKHEIDTCKECIVTHLATQLSLFGRSRCDDISCLSIGCHRKLTYEEIRLYADDETFQKFDNYRFLNLVSAELNFRWCLRDTCENGCLYDVSEDPQIRCEECSFDMCFRHQVPWHGGLTCEQYESQHREEYAQNEEFIGRNTKPCPGCGVNVEKGELCFHMTCPQCHFEYCWVCLANWQLIRPNHTTYVREMHKEDCWFRTSELEPTSLRGESVEAAFRSYQRRR